MSLKLLSVAERGTPHARTVSRAVSFRQCPCTTQDNAAGPQTEQSPLDLAPPPT